MSNNNSDTAPTAPSTQRRSVQKGNAVAETRAPGLEKTQENRGQDAGRNGVVGIDKVRGRSGGLEEDGCF